MQQRLEPLQFLEVVEDDGAERRPIDRSTCDDAFAEVVGDRDDDVGPGEQAVHHGVARHHGGAALVQVRESRGLAGPDAAGETEARDGMWGVSHRG